MPQFATTIKHIQEGVKGFTINAAVKNIEGWEETLKDMDTPGVKSVVRDLGVLKRALQEEEIDGGRVKEIVARLGRETVTLADKSDSKKAEQVKELGQALEGMSTSA